MQFLSIPYAIFLLSFLGLYWTVGSHQWRLLLILVASLVFYASFQFQYIPLLLVSIFINFQLGRELGIHLSKKRSGKPTKNKQKQVRETSEQTIYPSCPIEPFSEEDLQLAQANWNPRRFAVLWFGIGLNILLLLGFKYVPFALETIAGLLNLSVVQQRADWFSSHILAPLGLSFFCFECIAYLIDVYRGAPASQRWLEFAAYKFFFPKLLSGPITRYHHLMTQLKSLQLPNSEQVTEGLWLIACGAVKKGLLADRLGILVELSFNNLQRAGSGDLWLATAAYGLQLYLDFSSYVDIARGSAILMGLNLPENFDYPYFSTSIADFWRRWHITLGDWLRNYLYFPLGGSRQGLDRTCLNLLIVMIVAGIWHGAAWGFVVWGWLHGVALVIHRLTEAVSERVFWLKSWWQSIPGLVLGWGLTQVMVFTSWLWFRLPNLKDSNWAILHFWNHPADLQFAQKVYVEAIGLNRVEISLLLGLLAVLMGVAYLLQRGLKLELNSPLKILLVPVCLFGVWLLSPGGSVPFIYFDF